MIASILAKEKQMDDVFCGYPDGSIGYALMMKNFIYSDSLQYFKNCKCDCDECKEKSKFTFDVLSPLTLYYLKNEIEFFEKYKKNFRQNYNILSYKHIRQGYNACKTYTEYLSSYPVPQKTSVCIYK